MSENESTQNVDSQQQDHDLHFEGKKDSPLDMGDGPFYAYPLIKQLPTDLIYTCFEAYHENIYVGTITGELLHYFELEPFNYVLVSRTKFNTELDDPITKIILLPIVERALIQSKDQLKLYLLPEFAPVPNIKTIEGVTDFTVFEFSETHSAYNVYIAKKDKIFLANISGTAMTRLMSYNFKGVDKIEVKDQYLMTVRDKIYELIDLRGKSRVPLFYVTEGENKLRPIIVKFSETEFLMACGSSQNEQAMALIVNQLGDITKGTVVLEHYPNNVVVELPYIFADFGETGTYIYKIQPNSEIGLIQKIAYRSLAIGVVKLSKSFDIPNSIYRDQVVEKLRLVPLVSVNPEFRMENEKIYMAKIFKETTSLALFDSCGLHLLQLKPEILQFDSFDEGSMKSIASFLRNYVVGSKYQEVEKSYLETMLLLLEMLHCDAITTGLAVRWCEFVEYVDMRLFLYVNGFRIYGDLWINKGLNNLVAEMVKLKLINKFENSISVLRKVYQELKNKYANGIKDAENILLSFDMIFLADDLKHDKEILIDTFNEGSLSTIAEFLELDTRNHSKTLLEIYKKLGSLHQCLDIYRNNGDELDTVRFIFENFKNLQRNREYKEVGLKTDIINILNTDMDDNKQKKVMDFLIKVFELGKIDPKSLIREVSNGHTKVTILEKIGATDATDAAFLLDYYIAQLQECMAENDLWNDLAIMTTSYSQELNYLKPTIAVYLETKLKYDPKFMKFMSLREKIINLSYDKDTTYDKLSAIDISNILILLFFTFEDLKPHISNEDMLKLFLTLNDFVAVESLVSEDNFVFIMHSYLEISTDGSILRKYLERKIKSITNSTILTEIILLIPQDYQFESFFEIIFPIFRKYHQKTTQQEIKKSLLKHNINEIENIIKKLKSAQES
ncbi:CORVET complex subunit VPS3 Ecym_3592 [Eremothecium cymbalariae DBVPG|uniref:CNH domain-containing protein n=1 Tax=Eremothecium cymbalariae (strain CBS 270.75 / DBVPG 7215 / KCTC 17166 / NRRL Y-17582) TaxID=931890 RepID=G8JQS4_ERECY|nr:Hypothetical protein Ecym_3592 [Eremothecium cymbalariae DBVPG\